MKHDELSLEQLLKDFSSQRHLKDKLLDKKLEELWKGHYQNIASYTGKVQFKNGILIVWITSAPLKQELNFHREKMIKQVNELLKQELIQQLEFR
jgi:hypothetical protein